MERDLVATARSWAHFMVDKVEGLYQFNEKLKAMTGTKGKMEKLKELSTILDMVIQDMEPRPFISHDVKDLLKKLTYLAYDLEDVVDYYDTKVLQKKQRSKAFLRPVRYFFSTDTQVVFKGRVGGMIKTITKSLDSILLQMSFLLNLLQGPQGRIRRSEPRLYRETYTINRFDVKGREPEKNMIIDMLTKDDDDESNHGTVKVIAIVGMDGLGKTTLAQLVFNDERVKAHFESSRMWTVVGAEFDPAKIMKSVLELATNNPSVNFSEMESVRQNLEKALSGKKFLLVLDDVWNENVSKWNVLKAALTCGARGSKILVTTHSQQVSSSMGASNTTHQIQQLSGDDCLSLFQQFAFGDEAPDQTMMAIGRKIVEKCGGVPLAAISLGSMLHGTQDETYWSSVLKSEKWQLRDGKQNMVAVLKLSYDSLSPQSKKCFAFGSLFPKDYTMRKDELIKLWIANGFVRSEGNFEAEIVGNRIFDDLVSRSFFLLAPSHDVEDDSHVTMCTMHYLMHDLARSVSAYAYWNSNQDSVEDIGNRTYHLQIHRREESSMTQVLAKKPLYLRTFMSQYAHLSINLLEVLSELKFLRVLDLTHCGIREVSTSIRNLIHLRYLNLSNNKIEVLPDSITLLPNLQYLNLSFNEELRELPKELRNMQNLQDLNFFQSDFRLTHIPSGLSRLINLRSLPLFIVGDKTGACSITELEDLKLHGEMTIKFSPNCTNYSCGGRKILKNKDFNELCIKFNGSERYDKEMLNDLCPNTSLKKLSIWGYGSPQFPTWLIELQLPNLVEVNLCCDCQHIPPFGNLQFLKKLCLQSMAGITQMGAEFHGYKGFPSLQELFLTSMDNLEEWSEFHDVDELFPSLQRLKISRCPKLKCMPRFPRIQYLDISYCSVTLLSCVGRLTSLSVLRVEAMDDMTSLPSGCIRNLTSLIELQIIECRQLQSLPRDEMQHLKMLRSLIIQKCDNLSSFPAEVGCLRSLCFLLLSQCPSIILQPEELVQILNSVDKFQIQICGNKCNLRGQLQHLHAFRGLSLIGVHDVSYIYKVKELSGNPKISICCCDELESLMTTEVANSTVLEELYIDGIINLTTLPDWLQYLKSLRLLSIRNCPLLERVPWYLKNLRRLEDLRIVGCPQLESRCKRETGEDWSIISHVPYVDIRSSDSAGHGEEAEDED